MGSHRPGFVSISPPLPFLRFSSFTPPRRRNPHSPLNFRVAPNQTPWTLTRVRRLRATLPDLDESSKHVEKKPENSVATDMDERIPLKSFAKPGLEGSTPPLDARVLFGEFLSTFLFVYLSVTSASSGTVLKQALNNGAVIAAVAASFMPVSGAHLNPAVTLALAITNRVSVRRAVAFVPVQLAAAVAACMLVRSLGVSVVFQGVAADAAGVTMRMFLDEVVPMFMIVAVVFQTAVATEEEGGVGGKVAALYIGLIVLACAGTFQGVFNPARAFGPAVVTGNFGGHWVFWVGPFVGAAAAALISEHVFLAPAGNRKPNSWLQSLSVRTARLGRRVRVLGVAGIIAYGILNIFFYGITIPVMLYKIGSISSSSIVKACLMAWGLSNVTKPIRLILTIAMAPFIQRRLTSWRSRRRVH